MATRVIQARHDRDVSSAAAEGARILREGGLVGFATETVYGIAAVATRPETMERLRELKSRPKRPFSVHIAHRQDAARYVRQPPPDARKLMEKGWPGPITVLLAAGGRLADTKLNKAGLYEILCDEDYVGLRCPDSPVATRMLAAAEAPVVAPSANLAGHRSPRTAEEVLEDLDGKIDLLIDSGPTRYGKDSTIVRFDAAGWSIVRKGVYDERTIRRLLKRRYLFVCTGNTCRSPMAAGLFKRMLAERLGATPGKLRNMGVEVESAGILAGSGARASPEAVHAARQLGADISRHRSERLHSELIDGADLVFCMTDFHVAEVLRMAPSAGGKVRRLDPSGDVPDPIGCGADVYCQAARRIERALKRVLDKGLV